MRVIATAAPLLAVGAAFVLCASIASAQTAPGATATMKDTKGQNLGKITLTQHPFGVVLRGELDGLPPGWHAIHIHAAGKCEPDFAAAGPHFNPANVKHGLAGKEPHAGDLPNFYVDERGHGRFEAMTPGVTMRDGAPNSVFGPNGTAIIVHAKSDDYATDPAGDSGDRIACGVIRKG
ncbi:MAG TPA: superoxide dismutase family protein [Azospirillum sp.]|nr:superoxide dismutase family protein [Azospirillum sp.]